MEFRALGPLTVLVDGVPVDLGGAKQRKVLQALVLARGSVVSTERLIDIVWGDTPPSKPNVTLRTYVSHLRRALEPAASARGRGRLIVTRSPGYALDVDPENVDIRRFERLVGEAQELRRAGDLDAAHRTADASLLVWPSIGPEALDTVTKELADVPGEATHLIELHQQALDICGRSLLESGRPAEAVPGLEQGARCHPLSEQLRLLLMLGLYRAGRAADALAVAQDLRTTLREELGLDPTPAMVELEHQILTNDPKLLELAAPARPNNEGVDVAPIDRPIDVPLGRDVELAIVTACLPDRASRPANVAVLTGPAGIGKTTLLDALAAVAEAEGATVTAGRCRDGGGNATLAPWLTVLRDLIDGANDDLDDLLGDQGPELARLVPELATRFPVTTSPDADAASLHDAIIRTLRRFSRRSPVVVLFEDLHWADTASLEVLTEAVAALAAEPIAFACTWRDTDVAVEAEQPGTRETAVRCLADIGRAAGPCRITLDGLTIEAATELFVRLHGTEPDPEHLRDLVEHTGGNALYLSELIRASRLGPDLTPTDTVRDAVLRRLDPLPAGTDELLTIGAQCPAGFDEDLLAEISGMDFDDVTDRVEAALAAQLIIDDPQHVGQLRFSHDLLAETMAARLRSAKQADLHARIGAVLDKREAPDDQVAYHYLLGARAGSSIAGAGFAQRSALSAVALSDHQGAVTLLEAALDALDVGPEAEALRADILLDLAQSLKHLQRQTDSHAASIEAFGLAENDDNADFMVMAALVYCGVGRIDRPSRSEEWLGYWAPPGPGIEMLEKCLRRIPADHRLRPNLLLHLSTELYGTHEDGERSLALSREGMDLARQSGNLATLCEGLFQMAAAHARLLTADERQTALDEALELAVQLRLGRIEIGTRRLRMALALDRGDLDGALGEVAEAKKRAERSGDPLLQMQAEVLDVSIALMRGRFDQAEQQLMAGFADYERFGRAVLDLFGVQYSNLQNARGELDEVEAMLRMWLEGYEGPAYSAPLAAVLARNGKLDEAREVIDHLSTADLTSTGEGVLQFMTPSFFAEVAAELGDTELARSLLPVLAPAAGRLVSMFGGVTFFGSGSYYLGRLHTTIGDFDEAARLLADARHHMEAVDAQPDIVRVMVAQAELASARGHAEAGDLLGDAAAAAAPLGMEWLIERTRARLAP